MLSVVEQSRIELSQTTTPQKKSDLGQFFTSEKIADFMAGLFACTDSDQCVLLDAGAGIGSLSAAFMEKWISDGLGCKQINIDAFEIDETLIPYLRTNLKKYQKDKNVTVNIRHEDFIKIAVDSVCGSLFAKPLPRYTHAILNPPYKKILSSSEHWLVLRDAGIKTVNMYSAFVALSLCLLDDGGQLVAIIPRSFCNGPYYQPFRKFILARSAIRHIHIFESRNSAFKDDSVLQENVIIMLQRGAKQSDVTVTASLDDSFADLQTVAHPFHNIVTPDNPNLFIHIPTDSAAEISPFFPASVHYSLDDIGVMVSTGPVVDFRLKEYLCEMPEPGTMPLLYPGHFTNQEIEWPKPGFKKPNAITYNDKTKKWFYPNGFYSVVRRFSSKEENRRIVARLVHPDKFPNTHLLGFENHLNVFHDNKQGLPKLLAYGLTTFLNTTFVDRIFRRFNGHTQVNATDLRSIKYPSRKMLMSLGEWTMQCDDLTQPLIDQQVQRLCA